MSLIIISHFNIYCVQMFVNVYMNLKVMLRLKKQTASSCSPIFVKHLRLCLLQTLMTHIYF